MGARGQRHFFLLPYFYMFHSFEFEKWNGVECRGERRGRLSRHEEDLESLSIPEHLATWQDEKRLRRFSKSRPAWGRPHPPTSWSGVIGISIVPAQTSVGVYICI